MDSYEKGDPISMLVPLPPFLHESHGESFFADVVYEGLISDQDLVEKMEEGSVKIIYNCLDNENHHLVSWEGDYWINDLLEYAGEDISFKSIV